MKVATGELGRKLSLAVEVAAKCGLMLRGRQALFIIYEHFKTAEKAGALFELTDLMAIKRHGSNLQAFITSWDTVLAGMKNEPTVETKEVLLYEQLKDCEELIHDMAYYHRDKMMSSQQKYDFLLSAVREYLERKRQEENRKAVVQQLRGGRPAAPANTTEGEGKGKGKAKRDRSISRDSQSSRKSKGGGKGQRSSSNKPEACRNFAKGLPERQRLQAFALQGLSESRSCQRRPALNARLNCSRR
jgi:hypothetical protein